MIRLSKLALASTFAIGLALPALAQTTSAPVDTTPPAATDSGIKAATPNTTPAKTVKAHAHHIKHTTKMKMPAPVKS